MLQKYFFICNYLLLIALGIYHYKKIIDSPPLKMFLFFLIYSFFTEVAGMVFAYYLKINTAFVYNSWNIVSYLFYSYFFLSKISSQNKRRLIKIFTIIFIILFLINALFFQKYMNQIFSSNIILGKILMIVTVMLYYTELLKSDLILNIKESLFFWISLGIFIYSIGFIPVFVIAEYISYQGAFRYITFGLNILMSLCFITGFLISKKQYNM